jgi:hypothetical protein
MTVWTTPELSGLLSEGMPFKALPGEAIKSSFLENASSDDVAVTALEEDYMDFLAAAKTRGMRGPLIFVSPEPAVAREELLLDNAIILDLKRLGADGVKRLVNFIIGISGEWASRDEAPARAAAHSTEAAQPGPGIPADASEVISCNMKERVPVVAALQFCRAGDVFSARLTCEIKSLAEDLVVLHRFRPAVVNADLKLRHFDPADSYETPFRHGHELELGDTIAVLLTHRGRSYEAVLGIEEIRGEELWAKVPDSLLHERRRHVRVEPDPAKPVELFMLMPGEPTMGLALADLSQRGIGFLSGRDLTAGDIYSFTLMLPEPRHSAGAGRDKVQKAAGLLVPIRGGAGPAPFGRGEDCPLRHEEGA